MSYGHLRALSPLLPPSCLHRGYTGLHRDSAAHRVRARLLPGASSTSQSPRTYRVLTATSLAGGGVAFSYCRSRIPHEDPRAPPHRGSRTRAPGQANGGPEPRLHSAVAGPAAHAWPVQLNWMDGRPARSPLTCTASRQPWRLRTSRRRNHGSGWQIFEGGGCVVDTAGEGYRAWLASLNTGEAFAARLPLPTCALVNGGSLCPLVNSWSLLLSLVVRIAARDSEL
jgi:hypothetical protein